MSSGGEEELCSKSIPKAGALRGHDWETTTFGVIVGVCRCRSCGVVSSGLHFRKLDVQAFAVASGEGDKS